MIKSKQWQDRDFGLDTWNVSSPDWKGQTELPPLILNQDWNIWLVGAIIEVDVFFFYWLVRMFYLDFFIYSDLPNLISTQTSPIWLLILSIDDSLPRWYCKNWVRKVCVAAGFACLYILRHNGEKESSQGTITDTLHSGHGHRQCDTALELERNK